MSTMTETIAEPYDSLLPHIALQRWESDGGAQLPQPEFPAQMQYVAVPD
jgi:hypothetical protein